MGGQNGKKARIVIGKDTRRSSYMFEYSLVGGIVASGADAYLMHVTTTPSVAYITRADEFDCGIMISASHNPYYDNGIKLINSKGEKMNEGTIAEVEKYLDGDVEVPFAKRENIGCTVDYIMAETDTLGTSSALVCTPSVVLKWLLTVQTKQAGISQSRYLMPWELKHW